MFEPDMIGSGFLYLFTEPMLSTDEKLNPAIKFAPGMDRIYEVGEYIPTKTWHYYYPSEFTILYRSISTIQLAVVENSILTNVLDLRTEKADKYLELPCYLGIGGLYPGEHSQKAMYQFFDYIRKNPGKAKIEDPVNWSEYAVFGGCLELLTKTYLARGFSYDYSIDRWEIQTKEAREICNRFIKEHPIKLEGYFEHLHIDESDQEVIKEVYDNLLKDDGNARISFWCDIKGFDDEDDCDEDFYPGYGEEYKDVPDEEMPHFICDEDSLDCRKCRYRKIAKVPLYMEDPIIPWINKYDEV